MPSLSLVFLVLSVGGILPLALVMDIRYIAVLSLPLV